MNKNSWDSSEKWYSGCVGEKGHYYHQTVIFPQLQKLLDIKTDGALLDLGCGQGVLARHLPDTISYWGVDNSKRLIQEAKKTTKKKLVQFIVSDASGQLPIEKKDFDWVCFILSLQNMEHPEQAISTAAQHLKSKGKLLIVLNHPCFRIPRQSHWGIDEKAKIQYRRLNCYMTPKKIPIQTNPGKGNESSETYSYHYPISSYSAWFKQAGLSIIQMEEWCSDKKSEGTKSKMEDRARLEFPLFLAFLAQKK